MSIGSVSPAATQAFGAGQPKPTRQVLSPLRPPHETQPPPQAARPEAAKLIEPNRTALEAARTGLERALAAGREAAVALADVRAMTDRLSARTGGEGEALVQLTRTPLQRYGQMIEAAGPLFAGAAVSVPLDSEGGVMELAGEDVRLPKALAAVAEGDADGFDAGSFARQTQSLSVRLDGALARFSALNDRVAAHLSLLEQLPAEMRAQVNPDLDAEGAQIAALNVRQAMAGESAAIANAAPRAILSFFRE